MLRSTETSEASEDAEALTSDVGRFEDAETFIKIFTATEDTKRI